MDNDYYNQEDLGVETTHCPKCHSRKTFMFDDAEAGMIDLQCDNCGIIWTYDFLETNCEFCNGENGIHDLSCPLYKDWLEGLTFPD